MEPLENPTPPEKKTWITRFHDHPYAMLLTGAGILLLFGSYIVFGTFGNSSSGSGSTWGGSGNILLPLFRELTPNRSLEPIPTALPNELPFIPLPDPTPEIAHEEIEGLSQLSSLLDSLTRPKTTSETDTSLEAYSFIPSGLIQIGDPQRNLTASQRDLLGYGNDVGAYIQGFMSLHMNMPQRMRDHAEDRNDPDKAAQVKKIGEDFVKLSKELTVMRPVPSLAAGMHAAYATNYGEVGQNLIKVANSTNDKQFLDAVTAYNASVDKLNGRFLALVNLFEAHDVRFTSFDQGSIFMFSASPSF